MTNYPVGPCLVLDDVSNDLMRLSALVVMPDQMQPDPLRAELGIVQFIRLATYDGLTVWRARFDAALTRPSTYSVCGKTYEIAGGLTTAPHIAFASCNGEEAGDLEREGSERNAMWERLRARHCHVPISLLIHGGDQIYADEATHGHPLSHDWPERLPKEPTREAIEDLKAHLRSRFFARYLSHLRSPEFAWLAARVPSLSQWDDHDICDGWGSLRRSRTYSPVGQALFDVAREMALLFQHATVAGDLPARFHDPDGAHLGWSVDVGSLRIIAPDLRSERTRRRVMGPGGWGMMEDLANRPQPERTLLVSSVPLLGPRLSILEALMILIPSMQKYEDDLRDQWQSRAHREEWRRMLGLLSSMAKSSGTAITAISGEIHLATRATMETGGPRLDQLVASGVAHRPPPKAWARALGALASLGEAPLSGQPIAIRKIPGQQMRYVAERNVLLMSQTETGWTAIWDFEESGESPALVLAG